MGVKKDWVPLAEIVPTKSDECLLCAGTVPVFNSQLDELRNTIIISILQVRKLMLREVKCLPKDTEHVGGRIGFRKGKLERWAD